MRIRSIRPEFWSSEDVAALDWETRLVFIGLWSYVDDNGVGRDVDRLIVAELFPLDDDLHEASVRVQRALKLLEAGGQITRYTVDGKPYLHVTAFAKHQVINRPSKGRYPLPTSDNAPTPPPPTEGSVSPHATPDDGEGEKGRRGTTTRPAKPDQRDDGFAEFWAAYPRKEAKRKAEQAWRAALKRADRTTIMAGLQRFRWPQDSQYIPLPASWLNADRWADQPSNVRPLRPDGDGLGLTDEQVDDVLGPDGWQLPPPPFDPEVTAADEVRAWARQQADEHRAARRAQAAAKLAGART